MEFTSRSIPFQITSGLRFFEQAHVKDVSSYIRFVVNRRDEVSFKRMVLMLPSVGDASAEKLWRSWLSSDAGKSEKLPQSFSATLLDFKVPAKAKSHWEQMCYTLDELVVADGEENRFAAPADMIYSILEGVYEEYMKNAFDNYENRKQDIGQLQNYATQYTDVMEFLAQLSLMSTVDGDPSSQGKKKQEEQKGVTLSSIHQAKGLEWKVVFLIWLADGMFPNGKILEADDNKMLEEERRLFYVALTRAKDQLYLSYPMMNPRSYSGEVFQHPSRFLDDFPPELVDEWKVSGW
jgi:DNA helicase-2/ATP-dependent DNA helicase PcrA